MAGYLTGQNPKANPIRISASQTATQIPPQVLRRHPEIVSLLLVGRDDLPVLLPWLDVVTEYGTVPDGVSRQVEVVVSSGSLPEGEYLADIIVTSNDTGAKAASGTYFFRQYLDGRQEGKTSRSA